jgi:Tfp pilus assembly protein PilF/2-polyprenyl-3-methyl-5-hydroxy-6-metoxy-1,4-benzoquinol methylase
MIDELAIREALRAGMEHHDAGRLAQAEAVYRHVLEAAPNRPDALVLLGDVVHRAGRDDDAIDLIRKAIGISPTVANFHNQLGLVLAGRGRLDEALSAYRRALRCKPDYAQAYFNLGNALEAQGRRDEAVTSFRRALAAQPDYAEAHNNLGAALQEQGKMEEAIAAYRAALQIREQPVFRANFARCIARAERLPADAGFRALVARALSEAWVRPGDLARTSIGLIRSDPAVKGPIDAALRAWPKRLAAQELFGASGLAALSRDRLLVSLLENAQVCEWDLERFLTLARHALLEAALRIDPGIEPRDEGLAFSCAVARQCFLNDYVFSCADEESDRAVSLREKLAAALESGADVPESWLAAVAAYFPLESVRSAATLLDRPWSEAIRALLVQQVVEPRSERTLRESIPKLTAVADGVSRRVQRQYEENPYPRWVRSPAGEPLSLEAHLRRLFPRAPFPSPAKSGHIDILVAGCGTGQESADLARQFPDSRVLAIDLSMASLGYALRKTHELGLTNVEYAQADIMELGSIGRSFDVISCVGVLHHLADPAAGWRQLLALLRPGGLMQVGLYSEIGRRDLLAARELIAARGYEPTPEGIRRCRQELLASGSFARLASLRDLYGMNECRDLLFHAQEHRFALPQVKKMVEALDLDFIGLAVEPDVVARYRRRFPGQGSEADLDSWHAFEMEFPDTFAGMYLFWVRKRDGS